MPFSESSKLSTLKQMMKNAVEQSSDWDTFKAEFNAMSQDFKDEVETLLTAEEVRAGDKETEWTTYKADVGDLKDELFS